jgi:hypothetical protein
MDHSEQFLHSLSKTVDASFEPFFVFPGQDVTDAVTQFKKNISIGAGLIQIGDNVMSTVAGTLRYREPVSYWVCFDFVCMCLFCLSVYLSVTFSS